ncbi:MAG TPA: dihydrofolate reductase family protein [Geodermatophilus sp.]|nr:dihydrofolate reductase family protein [Geodermatophilus sp.]
MTTIASISMSVDGFVTGPDDRPGQGLGVGGERLHYWVFGGPWTYDGEHDPVAISGEDKAYYDGLIERIGSGIVGRGMYDAAGAWGGENPFPGTLVVLTHRTGDPHDESFTFVDGLDQALRLAREAAGDEAVSIGGGADVIRQALAAGEVDELCLSTVPVVLGTGKPLFDGSLELDLEPLAVHQSRWATHVRYAVIR